MTNVHQLRPQGKPGQPLPPLSKRSTRVLLLASSYHDACTGLELDPVHQGKPGSRMLVRSTLWHAGSYQALERLLDELRAGETIRAQQLNHRALYRAFWARYIGQRFPAGAQLGQRERDTAVHATGWLEARMPAEIYVPAEVAEAAGYLPSEAKAFERAKRQGAA